MRVGLRVTGWGGLSLLLTGLALLGRDVLAATPNLTSLWVFVGGAVLLIVAAILLSVERKVWRENERATREQPTWTTWVALGAGGLLFVMQLLLPLRYYFGNDPYDERFAWRMFSTVRQHQCRLSAQDTRNGQPVPVSLPTEVHVGWITLLRRNRSAVVRKYLRFRCGIEGVEAARLENRCRDPQNQEVPPITHEIDCETGDIDSSGGL